MVTKTRPVPFEGSGPLHCWGTERMDRARRRFVEKRNPAPPDANRKNPQCACLGLQSLLRLYCSPSTRLFSECLTNEYPIIDNWDILAHVRWRTWVNFGRRLR
jgi:hypothetical protein